MTWLLAVMLALPLQEQGIDEIPADVEAQDEEPG